VVKAKDVIIDSTNTIAVQIDGDLAGSTLAHFSVIPSAIHIIV
jgi:diacylglycerol kinase family enzyme